jgi:hypothetical protein
LKRTTGTLLILIVFLMAAGGVFYFTKVLLLQLENTDHPRTIEVEIRPSERFTVFYVHSIYGESVTEEFQADEDGIVLKGVKTKSPAILEYFGFEDMKEFHPMNVVLGAIYFRVGMGEGQWLIVRERKIYLSEIGARGDRIRLRVKSVSLGYYLFLKISR